jgi:tRNA (cytidine/uridine-2'-O-)-methyltransferase
MLQVALYEPEIPPNAGNIMRLCAATGARLHLIGRLGFRLDDRSLRRAGLDYLEFADVRRHARWEDYAATVDPSRCFAFSTRGTGTLASVAWRAGDSLVFGSESSGLPAALRSSFPPERLVRLPLLPGQRSLNLSNAVAVAVFEAWRVNGYAGGA